MSVFLVLFILIMLFSIIFFFFKYKQKNAILSGILSFVLLLSFGAGIILYGFRDDVLFARSSTSASEEGFSQEQRKMLNEQRIIKIKDSVLIDAPVIPQFPELPRGCEVTSLSMLLHTAGVEVDKMVLAEQVKKDPADRETKDGKIHFGNPHKGFVGNMYTYEEPGYGVYNEPIYELAEQYLPEKMINLTGQTFEELKIHLSDGRPIWVIINTQYRKLEDSYFKTWHTSDGPIRITMKEHSVIITGYDDEYIYFNDPLTGQKNRKEPMKDFEASWVQMGSQAITYKLE